MSHIVHEFAQGSEAWHAHRAKHFNASEAPAMLGISPYQDRSALLKERALGITTDISSAQQALFDSGHRFEAQARPWAEGLLGGDLYPITASREVDGLPLSASYDGVTMAEDAVFEHKTLNATIAASLDGGVIPEYYRAQMEQQLLIIGAERALFMASNGDQTTMRHEWYESDPAMRARIVAGWKQFQSDLQAYQHVEAPVPPAASPTLDLPAVSVKVAGQLAIQDNFQVFEKALRDFLENRLIREPKTDQDFVDLDAQIKTLQKAEDALDAAESYMLTQVEAVDLAKRTKDMLHKLTRDNRLMAEKLLASEKERRRAEILKDGQTKLAAHVAKLNARIERSYMPAVPADFASAMKGLRTIASLEDAVATTLANAKIAADEMARRIMENMKMLAGLEEKYSTLFPDEAQQVLLEPAHFKLLVQSRQTEYERRLEAERQRIRQEEEARAQQRAAPPPATAPTPTSTTAPATAAPLPAEDVANMGARDALEAWVNAYGHLKPWAPLAATIRAYLNSSGRKRRVA